MIDVTVKLDPKVMQLFGKTVQDMIALTEKPTKEIVQQQARLLARNAAWWTQRPGFNTSVKSKHDESIASRVNSIYRDPMQLRDWIRGRWGDEVWRKLEVAINAKDVAEVRRMLRGFYGRDVPVMKWDGGAQHRRWKKNPRSRFRAFLLGGERSKNAYIKRQQGRVGNAKSGWARAAEKIGGVKNPTRGIPGWAKKKNHKAKGFGSVTGTGANTQATLINYAAYGMDRNAMNQALRQSVFNMKRIMRAMLDRNTKNAVRAFNKGGRAAKKLLS